MLIDINPESNQKTIAEVHVEKKPISLVQSSHGLQSVMEPGIPYDKEAFLLKYQGCQGEHHLTDVLTQF
jgi:hypothetical protein